MNKKLLSLFVASLLPVALLAGSGDVNGDGKVNIADIVEFLNYFKGNPSSDFNLTEADTNNDGTVDQADVEAIAHTIMTDNLPHLYVLRHLYHIPSDHGHFKIFVSFVGDDAPLLTYPDGTISEPFFYDGYYYWDIWCEDSNARTEKWFITSGDFKDSVIVNYTGLPLVINVHNEICFSADETEYVLDTSLPNTKLNFNVEGVDWYYNEEGKPVVHFTKNESGQKRHVDLNMSVGNFEKWYGASLEQTGRPFKHTPEEHMAALHDFCDATDFANWGKNLNWWGDEPMWKWDYSINHDKWSNYYWQVNDRVVSMYFGGGQFTGLRGTLPASFEVFMDDCLGDINLTNCALYGKIPDNIRHHDRWPEFGWTIIQQMPYFGGGFDMEDINLRIDDVEVTDFINNTTSTTYEMLKNNKITWVFNAGAVDMIGGVSDEYVNKYLDYCDKGLGAIATVGELWTTPYDSYCKYILGQYDINDLPKSIIWTKGFDKADIGSYGSMSILDSEGNLLWYALMDGDMPTSFYLNPVDSVCRKYLGDPSAHDVYVSTHYESVDYSQDGKVLTLQEATVGKGIDLVFLGDQYVDTLLVEGGQFEMDMAAAMEYFFGIEPYKSLRDRFNVYAVKAVSPNGYDGTSHKFNYDSGLVFEYAQKVEGIDMDNVTITVINYNPNYSFFVIGETSMWESGASIAFIEQGGPSDIICHESGGHGFAKLLDEYIYSGYEQNSIQEGAYEDFRSWIQTSYHDKGWGMNVSATDNPEEVPWAHFLTDDRYKDEIGIHQGAWMWPNDLWRPSENSVMNNDYSWFNAPSREAIYKRVMKLSEGDDWTYDYETFVAFDAPAREAFKAAQARSKTRGAEAQKRRVESRPPKIFKGSWRDAGKCEKVELFKK